MATSTKSLIVAEPLCFLLKKYGRYAVSDIKSVLYNFYSSAQLAAAKQVLAEVLTGLKLDSAQKLLRRRRDSKEHPDAKTRHDIDDVMAVIAHLDEQKTIDQLPTFVTSDPDLLPSSRFCDGDVLAILNKLEKLEDRFATVQQELDSTRSLLVRNLTTSGAGGDAGGNRAAGSRYSVPFFGEKGRGPVGGNKDQPDPTGTASQPSVRANRLWGDTETSSARESEQDDDGEYMLQVSRSARRAEKALQRKRPRASESPPSIPSAVNNASAPNKTSYTAAVNKPAINSRPNQPGKKNILIGQSTNCSIKASKNLNLPKAIYRIGNVDPGYTPEILTQYIESLNVRVLSCYDRTSPETRYTENKSFRVCIVDADKSKLLCADSWSVGITISRWVFKKKTDGTAPGDTGVEGAVQGVQEGAAGGEREMTGGEEGTEMEGDESEAQNLEKNAGATNSNA